MENQNKHFMFGNFVLFMR